MDNLYYNGKLCKAAHTENKLLHDVARTYGRGVREEIIYQEVECKKIQEEVKGEVKVAVMKGDTTCPDVI